MAKKANGKKGAAQKTTDRTVVMLEVVPKHKWEKEKRKLVSLDLDDEDDWGDLEVSLPDAKKCWAEVGIDEDSRWRVVRAFKVVSLGDGLFQGKFPMAEAITLRELRDLALARLEEFCG